jgi:hypothetical protein
VIIFQKHGKCHRTRYLDTCLKAAQEWEDEVAKLQILTIIQRGKDWVFWHRLNFALGKHLHDRSVWAVQVEDDHGEVLNYEIEEGVQKAVFNEVCPKCCNLAEDAPICKGALRGQFGYTTTSPSAQLVLDGLYTFPSTINDASMELFLENFPSSLNCSTPLSHMNHFAGTLATVVEEGEGGHLFVPVRLALWSLYCRSRL